VLWVVSLTLCYMQFSLVTHTQVALRRSLGTSHALGMFVSNPKDGRFLRAEGHEVVGYEHDSQVRGHGHGRGCGRRCSLAGTSVE